MLDPYLVRWFVETARAEDIAELEAIQRKLEKAARSRDFRAFHIQNGLFHGAIYRRHFNTEALRITNLHQGLLKNLSCRYPANHTRMMQACVEHRALLQAAHTGDVEPAAQAVRTHIERSNAYILGLPRVDRNDVGGSLPSAPLRDDATNKSALRGRSESLSDKLQNSSSPKAPSFSQDKLALPRATKPSSRASAR